MIEKWMFETEMKAVTRLMRKLGFTENEIEELMAKRTAKYESIESAAKETGFDDLMKDTAYLNALFEKVTYTKNEGDIYLAWKNFFIDIDDLETGVAEKDFYNPYNRDIYAEFSDMLSEIVESLMEAPALGKAVKGSEEKLDLLEQSCRKIEKEMIKTMEYAKKGYPYCYIAGKYFVYAMFVKLVKQSVELKSMDT